MPFNTSWQGYAPDRLLLERFHITTGFHPGQREIIEQLAQGKRILAIQRTGWGKSLCYQMASLYYPHLTIVFSPLKALMRDQCQRCNEAYNIPASIISSDFRREENEATLEQAVAGKLKLLFIAPERLNNALWQTYVTKMRISVIVIDEAHCISTWGHDFRPDYRRIVRLVQAMPPHMPILALTATANRRVETDILNQIGDIAQVLRGTMQRPNLYLHVEKLYGDQAKLAYLSEIIPHIPGSGIVYTATRHDSEMVAAFLQQQGISAEYYHAGRDDETRQDIEQGLMANRFKVVCSTVALGMGIDKPDIRFIIHYQIPASPINYYQEMGRAGRDGKVAWCVLLYDPADLDVQRHFIEDAKPSESSYDLQHPEPFDRSLTAILREQKQHELDGMRGYAESTGCLMEYLTNYLGDIPDHYCQTCGHCRPSNFPAIRPSERAQRITARFLVEFQAGRNDRYQEESHKRFQARRNDRF